LSYLGYITIYSLVRASGGRFLQEIDWIALVYFSIGIVEVLSYLIRNKGERTIPSLIDSPLKEQTQRVKPRNSLLIYSTTMIFLLTAGSLPVIVERLIPSSYPDEVLVDKIIEVLQKPQEVIQAEDQNRLIEFVYSEGSALVGRAYYPRYFEIGENLEDIRPEVLGNQGDRYDYQRTEFYLIGSDTIWVVLYYADIPDFLPYGSEVFAIGCKQDGTLDAVAVFVLAEENIQHVYWRDDKTLASFECPLGN